MRGRGHGNTEHDPPAELSAANDPASVEHFVRATLRQIRRLAIALVGLTVVLVGGVMVVTPGPAIVVVPLGLSILAAEFAWARRLLQRVRERAATVTDRYRNRSD